MIPLVIPPLTNLCVLVTRPAPQSQSLCDAITQLGGEAIACPFIEIKPRSATLSSNQYDLVIFVSVNAVMHGVELLKGLPSSPQIAAIGQATAAALQSADVAPDITAPSPFNSEALLQLDALQSPPKNILIVRGVGGRELLRETLGERGSNVDVVEVYERVSTTPDEQASNEVQNALRDNALNIITVTSVEIADALLSLSDQVELAGLRQCAVIAGSQRIATHLSDHHWHGAIVVSNSPDDASMINALIRWHTRARN